MRLTEAIRKTSYPQLPRLLVVQLKRFGGGMKKIRSHIPTPFTLQCFCDGCISDANESKLHEYKLYSVITHVGSTLQSGHYIAYICAFNQNGIYGGCVRDSRTVTTTSTSPEESVSDSTQYVSLKLGSKRRKLSTNDVGQYSENLNGNDVDCSESESKATVTNNSATINERQCPSKACCGTEMISSQWTESSVDRPSNNFVRNESKTSDEDDKGKLAVKLQHLTENDGATIDSAGAELSVSEPVWYKCNDAKIKAITQCKFREMLTSKRNKICPYLLFYVRNDVLEPRNDEK